MLLSGFLGSAEQGRAATLAEFERSLCVCKWTGRVTSNELAVWTKYVPYIIIIIGTID